MLGNAPLTATLVQDSAIEYRSSIFDSFEPKKASKATRDDPYCVVLNRNSLSYASALSLISLLVIKIVNVCHLKYLGSQDIYLFILFLILILSKYLTRQGRYQISTIYAQNITRCACANTREQNFFEFLSTKQYYDRMKLIIFTWFYLHFE